MSAERAFELIEYPQLWTKPRSKENHFSIQRKRWKVSYVTSKKKDCNEKWERKPAAKY